MRVAFAVAAMAALLLSGCASAPHRVTVAQAALDGSGLAWTRSDLAPVTSGWFGAGLVETDYTFSPANEPPYAGLLQLFGLRDDMQHSTTELLALARSSVENATAANGIEVEGAATEGSRTLRNGLATRWFTLEGTVVDASGLFSRETRVRILGETGYDAASKTHVVAVAIAQVDATTCPPIVGPCTTRTDLTTWTSLVGDTRGTISNAKSSHGLIDNLVSHD
ncbi:MAG: hypothetical protein AABX89_00705 [Candidatus Thermoplasmatota archaeon]